MIRPSDPPPIREDEADVFTVAIDLDPDCRCRDCAERFEAAS